MQALSLNWQRWKVRQKRSHVSDAPLRAELFSGEPLRRHAVSLAGQHQLAPKRGPNWLMVRLADIEQAHYELAAGRIEIAKKLLAAMESFAKEGGLIPEQVWDSPDIPGRDLHFGRPSGSAMPRVWAHAGYLKLRRSLRDGRIFDLPPQTKGKSLEQIEEHWRGESIHGHYENISKQMLCVPSFTALK